MPREALMFDRRTKHGLYGTPIYGIWSAMITRCENPSHIHYDQYGGRGIVICAQWRSSVVAFADDMGPRPSPRHSLDRIDPDGNYEPSNCRWATAIEQGNNKRNNRIIVALGATRTVCEWSRLTGIGITTIKARLRRGWHPDRAVSEATHLPSEAA